MRSMAWTSTSTARRTCWPSWSVTSCWSLRARREERFERLVVRDAEEAAHPEQAAEGAQRDGLFEPELGVPRGVAGRLAARRIDEHPLLAVRDEAEADALAPAPRRSSVIRVAGDAFHSASSKRLLEVLIRRNDLDEQARASCIRPARRVDQHEVRPQGLMVLGHADIEALRAAPAGSTSTSVGQLERSLQDSEPPRLGGASGRPPLLRATPRRGAADSAERVWVMRIQPCGKTRSSTGSERKGPETSMSESHSAWWRALALRGRTRRALIAHLAPGARARGR